MPTGLIAKAVLQDTTPFTPALASSAGKLFLAWRGDGNDQLNVMYSTNDGAAFANKYISPETSTDAPALVDLGGTLYIGWKGDGNKNLNVAPVGVVGGLVTGFTTPAYLFQVNIPNFKVSPGDSVTCSVQYIGNKTAGQIAFKNVTTGVNFPITLVPPPGAAMSGNSAEWVIEVPTINNQYAHLPAFTPVTVTEPPDVASLPGPFTGVVEVEFASGTRVRISGAVEASVVVRIQPFMCVSSKSTPGVRLRTRGQR